MAEEKNVFTGGPFNHHMCERCWVLNNPDRWPNRLPDMKLHDGEGGEPRDFAFPCCYCGQPTWVRILTRDDIGLPHCNHDQVVTPEPEEPT